MTEIQTRSDIILLVDRFYEKVKQDQLLAPVFAHLDWPKHLPIMYNFWSSMLLGDQSYLGNPFQKHVGLPIGPQHFEQWLRIFTTTIDENFTGAIAEEAKGRAQSIAGIFQHKLRLYN